MSDSSQSKLSVVDSSIFHDFNREHLLLMVAGGYMVVKQSAPHFWLNLLYLAAVVLSYLFLICMAVLTMVYHHLERAIVVQSLQTLCLLLVGLTLPASKLVSDIQLDMALQILRLGVHNYTGEVADPEHDRIKGRRVNRIRFLMKWVMRLTFSCAFSNTFFIPLVQLVSVKEPTSDLNPYLPLPIYMPFDTATYQGFIFAFLFNAVFFFFLYITISCLIETYLSCCLQIIAQLEILNYSIENIPKRAFLNMTKTAQVDAESLFTEALYDDPQFQYHIYICLRENILHHHAILRLTDAVSPFLEKINSICIMSFSIVLAACIILILEDPTMNIALISSLTSDVYCYYEMCKVGQVITDKSAEVAQSLYFTPWHKCNKKFTVMFNIMLSNVQKPIIVRASGFGASASLQTYSDMMTLGYKLMNVFR